MPETRFARQVLLPGFGEEGQRRLGRARVVVAGAGGLGCALLPVLAASGVGEVIVVDDDRIDATNLHRQVLYGPADVGSPKAATAVARLAALGGRATALEGRVTAATAAMLVDGADLVIDATDDIDARYALDDATSDAGIALVWGSAVGFLGQVGVSSPSGPRWRDLFPVRPAGVVDTCAIVGVLPSLCTTVGGAMATEALKLLTGIGRPLIGRVLVFDVAAASVREIAYGATDDHRPNGETMPDIQEISPGQTAEALRSGSDVTLLDVREPWEAEIASLPGAVLIPLGELRDRVGELDPDREVIAYCHAGVRSLQAAGILQEAGLRVRSMAGGIEAWSRTVDPDVPRY